MLKKVVVISVIVGLMLFPAQAEEVPWVSAASAVLYDPLTGQCLYAKAENAVAGMASTTKIMTALVALEQYDTTQEVTIRAEWTGIEGSSMYLRTDECVTVEALLYGLLLASGNDAAAALAGLDESGFDGFVEKMNAKAAALGLENTHFDNPSGLDGENHHTTALELARLTAYALEQPELAAIVATRQTEVAGRVLTNHNRLLADEGVIGVKTGYTKACGRCLVTAMERQGRCLICVTLNAPDDWADHRRLYTYGFSAFRQMDLLGAGDCGSVPLVSSERKASRLYTNESFRFFLQEKELSMLRIELLGPRFLYGTVCAGQQYGRLRLRLGDSILFETPVYLAANSREIEPSQGFLGKLVGLVRRFT